MSLTFTGSAFDDTASNNRYVLTNNSNISGTMTLNVIPQDNLLLRQQVYLPTVSNNMTVSFGDSNNRLNVALAGSNMNLSFNASVLASCNFPVVYGSNTELAIRKPHPQARIAVP